MKKDIIGQVELVSQVEKVFKIFKMSNCGIKPHFLLAGPSGSSKTHTIENMAQELGLGYIEINAAQLTKEGTSGNSLSKALSPLLQRNGVPTVVFVDEFDKLFISGNSNSSIAHESTLGVQNEFLKILEGNRATVYADYGKYTDVPINNILFVFAGAFNGEPNMTIDKLRDIGVKTEFLGRVGIVFNSLKLSLDELYRILDDSPLLEQYGDLILNIDAKDVNSVIKTYLKENYELNTIGARMIPTLIHQYYINGGLPENVVKQVTFQEKIEL